MSSGAAPRFPTHLRLASDPTAAELQQVLGPDVALRRVIWDEDDQRICVRPPPFPFKRAVAAALGMLALMTVTPWGLSYVSKNPVALTAIDITVFAVLWAVLAPVAYLLLRRARTKVDALGPGAIIDKQSRELTLPWLERAVPATRIERFVDVRGRHHVRGAAAFLRQCAVVFRDDDDHFVVAPIARLLAPSMRKSCAARLADFYDVPLQEVTGVVFNLK